MKVHSRRDEIVAGLEEIFLKEGFREVRIEELASRRIEFVGRDRRGLPSLADLLCEPGEA